jgi:hypothetical protein
MNVTVDVTSGIEDAVSIAGGFGAIKRIPKGRKCWQRTTDGPLFIVHEHELSPVEMI